MYLSNVPFCLQQLTFEEVPKSIMINYFTRCLQKFEEPPKMCYHQIFHRMSAENLIE